MVVVVVCWWCGVVMTLNAPTVPPKAPDSKRSGATPVLRAIGSASHILVFAVAAYPARPPGLLMQQNVIPIM